MVNKFDAMTIILALLLIVGTDPISKPLNSRFLQIPFHDGNTDVLSWHDGIQTGTNIFDQLNRVDELAAARKVLTENIINSRTSGLSQSANNEIFDNSFTMDQENGSPDLSSYEIIDYEIADEDSIYEDVELSSIRYVAAQGFQGLFIPEGIDYSIDTRYSIYRQVDTLTKYKVDLLLISDNNDQVYVSFLTVYERTTRSMQIVYFYLEVIDNDEYPDKVSWNAESGLYSIYSSDSAQEIDLTEYLSYGSYVYTDTKELYRSVDVTNAMILGASYVIEEGFLYDWLADSRYEITQIYSFYKYGDVSVELSDYYRFEVEIDNRQGSTARINYELHYSREDSLIIVWDYGFNTILFE
jgi:hypothetical protein